MKTCTVCKETKPLDKFYASQLNKAGTKRDGDGRRAQCIECCIKKEIARREQWTDDQKRKRNRLQRGYIRKWEKRHPFSTKVRRLNARAKRLGVSGRVRYSELVAVWNRHDGKCWVCGFPATEIDHYRPVNRKSGGTNTADNILPICRECNQKRSHLWHGEVIAMKEAEMLKGLKGLLNAEGRR